MAERPLDPAELTRLYGPTLSFTPRGGWEEGSRKPPDRLVKTHCCFCGMQWGLQLKVRDENVVGFEPWEEFPFNRGTLCPKGVKRYLQGEHPDRLLTSLRRTDSGFTPIAYDEALDETVSALAAQLLAARRDTVVEVKALLAAASGRSFADQERAEREAQIRLIRGLLEPGSEPG